MIRTQLNELIELIKEGVATPCIRYHTETRKFEVGYCTSAALKIISKYCLLNDNISHFCIKSKNHEFVHMDAIPEGFIRFFIPTHGTHLEWQITEDVNDTWKLNSIACLVEV